MNKILPILLMFLIGACQNKAASDPQDEPVAYTETQERVVTAFSEVDSLLSIDGGAFWGTGLYGPIIVVDPGSRIFYSNENSPGNDFARIGDIYTDTLPVEINVANTAMDWLGKRWSMILLPLPGNKTSSNNLLIHELFHRIQPSIGYENLQELNNAHLDSYDGRTLLRFELQALENAVESDDSAARAGHIGNALAFRLKRQASPEIMDAENSLELNEGLAEYTALMLTGRNAEETRSHLSESKEAFYSNPTFVRSFAYQTIPYYGYLLAQALPDWHRQIDRNSNLTDHFLEAFRMDPDPDRSIEDIVGQNDYAYERILQEELERETIRLEKIARLKTRFTEQPVMDLPFQNMNISFDPRNITPLDDLGTVYPTLRVTDNWGILTVENGALLASNWSKVTVTEPLEISGKSARGDGWQLELNPGWRIVEKDGAYQLEEF